MDETPTRIKRSKWRLLLTLVTFAALAVLIYGVRKDIGSVVENLGKVNTLALLLIIPIEALNYDVYTRFYVRIFRILGKNVHYRDMYRLNLELNFVNHILPSGGVSGISYFTVRMRSYGVSGPKSTLSQLIKLLVLYISYQPILILGVFLLAIRGHVNNLVMVVASSIITLLVVGTFGFIYMIESRSRINTVLTAITKILNKIIGIFRRNKQTFDIPGAQEAFGELHDNYQLLKENWRDLKLPFSFMMQQIKPAIYLFVFSGIMLMIALSGLATNLLRNYFLCDWKRTQESFNLFKQKDHEQSTRTKSSVSEPA